MIPEPDLRARLAETLRLAPPGALRLFAYGALTWQRNLRYGAANAATLPGHAARHVVWDETSRGTLEAPSLTLGLVPGGQAHGIAFTVAGAEDLWPAWKQEMRPGHYIPAWLPLDDGAPALTFLADPASRLFAGERPEAETLALIASGEGAEGTARDYLSRTVDALRRIGRPDPVLDRLERALTAAAPARSPA